MILQVASAVLGIAGLLLSASLASGADIEVTDLPGSDRKLITISGRIDPDDGDKFKQKAGFVQKAVVAFKSDGGSLVAGLEIGTTIRLKNYWTAVLNGADCASACAFAWLGGTQRFMGTGSRVGFHAAYRMQDGKASESGVGNALVGAYLANLGMSNSAVVYITQSAPTEITWLTPQAAEKLGIEVSHSDGASSSPQVAIGPPGSAVPDTPKAAPELPSVPTLVPQVSTPPVSTPPAPPPAAPPASAGDGPPVRNKLMGKLLGGHCRQGACTTISIESINAEGKGRNGSLYKVGMKTWFYSIGDNGKASKRSGGDVSSVYIFCSRRAPAYLHEQQGQWSGEIMRLGSPTHGGGFGYNFEFFKTYMAVCHEQPVTMGDFPFGELGRRLGYQLSDGQNAEVTLADPRAIMGMALN